MNFLASSLGKGARSSWDLLKGFSFPPFMRTWLVVSTHLRKIYESQRANLPQAGGKKENLWNHHPGTRVGLCITVIECNWTFFTLMGEYFGSSGPLHCFTSRRNLGCHVRYEEMKMVSFLTLICESRQNTRCKNKKKNNELYCVSVYEYEKTMKKPCDASTCKSQPSAYLFLNRNHHFHKWPAWNRPCWCNQPLPVCLAHPNP